MKVSELCEQKLREKPDKKNLYAKKSSGMRNDKRINEEI